MSLWPFVSNLLNMQMPAWLLASSTPTTGSLLVHPALSGVTCRRSARLRLRGFLPVVAAARMMARGAARKAVPALTGLARFPCTQLSATTWLFWCGMRGRHAMNAHPRQSDC